MNKKQLIKQLKSITNNYEPLCKEGKELLNHKTIKEFADCLNNPDLESHLLATEIAQDEDETKYRLQQLKTPQDIIDIFKEEYLEYWKESGLIQISQKRVDEYRKHASSSYIGDQSAYVGSTISAFYNKTVFDSGHGIKTEGLDQEVIIKKVKEQEKLLEKGDLSSIEKMLHGQLHILNNVFNITVNKMANAQYINQIDVFSRIALKAQNQTRQTASTLAEIKGIKKTTFVHQLNQAHNQQVNNGAEENLSNSSNEKGINHVDRRSETARTEKNNENQAMALPEREKDARGAETLFNECSEARNEIS